MTFRQDSSTYYQYIAMLPFFLISSFVPYFLEPASLFYFFISLSFLIFSVFLVFFVFQSFRDCNWITINENGITCSKKGEQLWAYGWDSIAGFETTRHLKESAFEVLLNDMKPLKKNANAWDKFKHWMKDVNIKNERR